MVGIVRNAEIKFENKKSFNDFEKRISKQAPRISMNSLEQKVKADGIKINRNKENNE
ncbi:MAG: hypothetical protein ACI4T3_02370 [Lactobacillus sp.]